MPYRVTIQMPIECYEGKIALFLLPDVVLSLPPVPGYTIQGQGLYKTMPAAQACDTVIMGVGENLESGVVFCTVQGGKDGSYTPQEFLDQVLKPLNENWRMGSEDLRGDQSDVGDGDGVEAPEPDPYNSGWDPNTN